MLTELEIRRAEEYEMQLFGFNSRAVCATLERVVEEKVEKCCKKLSDSLIKIYKPDEKDAFTLRLNMKNLVKAYHSRLHHHARIMKKCIRKLIAVPHNVLLSEDQPQAIEYSQGLKEMEEQLGSLRSRARRATVLRAALKDELVLIEEIESQRNVVETISTIIENTLVQPEVNPEIVKCVSSCHALENIINSSNSEAANTYANKTCKPRIRELDLDAT